MTERVPPAIHKAAVAVIGLGAAAAGLVAGLLLAVLAEFGCSGTDASSPSDSAICDGYWAEGIGVAGWALAAGGPLFGMVASLGTARWRPLWIGIGVGLGSIFVLALLVGST